MDFITSLPPKLMGNGGLQVLSESDIRNGNYADAWQKVGRVTRDAALGDFERKRTGVYYEEVSLSVLYKMCKAGDVVLIREKVQIIPNVFVPASIARQVASSSVTGRFGGDKETHCPMWNRGGVICLNDGIKSIIQGTSTGIQVLPLKEVFRALKNTRAVVAVRRLRSMNKAFYASQLAPLVEALASDKGVQWMTLLVNKRQQASIAAQQLQQKQQEQVEDTPAVALAHATSVESSKSSAGSTATATPRRPTLIASAQELTDAVLHGVKKQVLSVHPSMEYEVLRVFYQLDERGSGELPLEDCIKAVGMISDQVGGMDSAKASKHLQDRTRALLTALIENGADCKRRNKTTGEIEVYIKFEDFLGVYRSLPLLYVPVEHDIEGILSGQVVTAVYQYLKVLDVNIQDVSGITISNFSSRALLQVELDVDHILDIETVCRIK